jgi:hippurate hydrolase
MAHASSPGPVIRRLRLSIGWVSVRNIMDTNDLVAFRHELHAAAEVGLHLPRTQALVIAAFDKLDVEIHLGTGLSSVVGVLRGAPSGNSVLLRTELDALPVVEQSELDFRATGEAMHACGHDLHATMLIGAAHLLAARRTELAGDVVLMFQPGEEGHGGAAAMLAEGVLQAAGSTPVAAYAVHVVSAMLPLGVFATCPGPLLAAADKLEITVTGAGGHGSAPHRARDPIAAAASIVSELQIAITREFDVFDPVVLTVGTIHGGTAHNVIPESVRMEATLRSFTSGTRARLVETATRVCHGIAAAHGLSVAVTATEMFPPTVNDRDESARCLDVARKLFGESRVRTLDNPLMGSEDFSLVMQRVPGAMTLIGACPPGLDPATAAFNHSPQALFDDAVLAEGAAFFAELALDRLAAAG